MSMDWNGVVGDDGRAVVELDCSGDDVLVKQEFVNDSDVNKVIARCMKMGVPLPGADIQSVFSDATQFGDFALMRQRVLDGEAAFMSLSAEVRREFDNDPAKLIEFVRDPANVPRAIELGLVPKPVDPPAKPAVVPAVSAPASGSGA